VVEARHLHRDSHCVIRSAKLAPDQPPKALPPSAPSNCSTALPPAQDTERAQPKFVRENSVASRQAPNAKASILDQLNPGKRVGVLAQGAGGPAGKMTLPSAKAGLRAFSERF